MKRMVVVEKSLKYFIFAKIPLFLVVLMDFFIAWYLKLYWVIEKAVTNSSSSIELNASNVLLGFALGIIINLILSIILEAFGSSHIKEVNGFDIGQIVFMGLIFWVIAAGLENSPRAAGILIVTLSLGEITFYTRWGSKSSLTDDLY